MGELLTASINLQSKYDIYAVINIGGQFYWDGSALFSDVMILFDPLMIGA